MDKIRIQLQQNILKVINCKCNKDKRRCIQISRMKLNYKLSTDKRLVIIEGIWVIMHEVKDKYQWEQKIGNK